MVDRVASHVQLLIVHTSTPPSTWQTASSTYQIHLGKVVRDSCNEGETPPFVPPSWVLQDLINGICGTGTLVQHLSNQICLSWQVWQVHIALQDKPGHMLCGHTGKTRHGNRDHIADITDTIEDSVIRAVQLATEVELLIANTQCEFDEQLLHAREQ